VTDEPVLTIPSPSLILLIGPAAGRSAFCRRNFPASAIVSWDECRDAAGRRGRTEAIAALAHERIEARLRRRRLAVLDGARLEPEARGAAREISARQHLPAIVVAIDATPSRLEIDRSTLASLGREGFHAVHVRGAASRVALAPLPCDRSADRGPFDIVGDIHGCAGELLALLRRLGYRRRAGRWSHPAGRRALFLGDLVDRGPRVIDAATIAMDLTADGAALAVPGNHDVELAALLRGDGKTPGPGTVMSLAQIAAAPSDVRRRFRRRFPDWVARLPSHLLLDGGRLAVSHAGLLAEYIGRDSEAVRRFALHGATLDTVDRYGLPIRVHWATAYRGRTFLVYGHTAVQAPDATRATLNIDTGCCYGGALTAFRWPEREVVQVRAARVHYRSPRTRGLRLGIRAETRTAPAARGGRPLRPRPTSS
jgi:protein phosphatase